MKDQVPTSRIVSRSLFVYLLHCGGGCGSVNIDIVGNKTMITRRRTTNRKHRKRELYLFELTGPTSRTSM